MADKPKAVAERRTKHKCKCKHMCIYQKNAKGVGYKIRWELTERDFVHVFKIKRVQCLKR